MDALGWNLALASLTLAVVHTALGPDHYLPFVMLGRARRWSFGRTLAVTAACGLGHVGSSLLLGAIGLAIGTALAGVEAIEQWRGSAAGFGLVLVGSAYALWGLCRGRRHRHGIELHRHGGAVHLHCGGTGPHRHDPGAGEPVKDVAFWALFLVFVLGPCEPLLPLFVAPASAGRWGDALVAAIVFGVATIGTMLAVTGALYRGAERLPLGPLERWSHALAGSVVALSGAGMLWLGL
ncbi:MAG: hypothetical protein Fur0037_26520 [Planctomycetota bacterium]